MKRETISKRTRFEVFKRDAFMCQYCGLTPEHGAVLVIDHRHPVARGGTNAFSNLITACHACNSGKGAVPLAQPHDLFFDEHKPRLVSALPAEMIAELKPLRRNARQEARLLGLLQDADDRAFAEYLKGDMEDVWNQANAELDALCDSEYLERWADELEQGDAAY
jgi:hypothetical protein